MYISVYEKYPICEHAEGGYYYEGRKLVKSWKVKHGKAKKVIQKIYNARSKDYENKYWRNEFETEYRWWISNDGSYIDVSNDYIGDGCVIRIESKRNVGKHESGWHPYE